MGHKKNTNSYGKKQLYKTMPNRELKTRTEYTKNEAQTKYENSNRI